MDLYRFSSGGAALELIRSRLLCARGGSGFSSSE
jgi:hypothetical protein